MAENGVKCYSRLNCKVPNRLIPANAISVAEREEVSGCGATLKQI